MTVQTYTNIVKSAKICTNNVKNKYTTGISNKWAYYFCKAILTPNKSITELNFKDASKPTGSSISRQITRAEYLDCAKRLIQYVETNKALPNYINWNGLKISAVMYTYLFADILEYYYTNHVFPTKRNVNTKVFTKPVETKNEVYTYFVKTFGSFGDTIDGALGKIAGNGYGYYYDDKYSNKQSIDRMKQGLGVNCTDSCQVFFNILLQLIKQGRYKKVECLHVQCQGGDGHVRLRITLNDGTKIYRDPAAVLSNGNVTSNWCMNGTIIDINPSWFMENLNR